MYRPRRGIVGSRLLQVQRDLETKARMQSFAKIFRKNEWGGPESRSGPGSSLDYTANVRLLIETVLKKYRVQRLADSPCGDCNWQPKIKGFEYFNYTGIDIVADIIESNREKYKNVPNMKFIQLDFSNNPFPFVPDIVICRDMVQHNSLAAGFETYMNIEESGAQFLITNWHIRDGGSFMDWNEDIAPGDWYRINVFTHPFNFSEPEMWIREGPGGVDSFNKIVGVWRLPVLGRGSGLPFVVSPSDFASAKSKVISVV